MRSPEFWHGTCREYQYLMSRGFADLFEKLGSIDILLSGSKWHSHIFSSFKYWGLCRRKLSTSDVIRNRQHWRSNSSILLEKNQEEFLRIYQVDFRMWVREFRVLQKMSEWECWSHIKRFEIFGAYMLVAVRVMLFRLWHELCNILEFKKQVQNT